MYCICWGSDGTDPTLLLKTSRLTFKAEVECMLRTLVQVSGTFHTNHTSNLEKMESVRALNTSWSSKKPHRFGEVEREQPRPTKECIWWGEGWSLVKVRVSGKNREQKVWKKEDDGLAGCHNEKRSACGEQMETKDRSKGRGEMKMADYQICLSKRTWRE